MQLDRDMQYNRIALDLRFDDRVSTNRPLKICNRSANAFPIAHILTLYIVI